MEFTQTGPVSGDLHVDGVDLNLILTGLNSLEADAVCGESTDLNLGQIRDAIDEITRALSGMEG